MLKRWLSRRPTARIQLFVTIALLGGCEARVGDGVIRCTRNEDCRKPYPYCLAKESDGAETYCYRDPPVAAPSTVGVPDGDAGQLVTLPDGGVAPAPASSAAATAVVPTMGSFTTVGPHGDASIVLHGDGFEHDLGGCTSDGKICLTGGFER